MMKPAKNTICLWYDGTAEEAATFYAKTFPDSAVTAVHRAPDDYPSGKAGGKKRGQAPLFDCGKKRAGRKGVRHHYLIASGQGSG